MNIAVLFDLPVLNLELGSFGEFAYDLSRICAPYEHFGVLVVARVRRASVGVAPAVAHAEMLLQK